MEIHSLIPSEEKKLTIIATDPIMKAKVVYTGSLVNSTSLGVDRLRRFSRVREISLHLPTNGVKLIFIQSNQDYILTMKTKMGWTSLWLENAEKIEKKIKKFVVRELKVDGKNAQRYVAIGESEGKGGEIELVVLYLEIGFGKGRSTRGKKILSVIKIDRVGQGKR